MKNTKEKTSYCIGLEAGKKLREQFDDVEESFLCEGFQDGLKKVNPKLPLQEIQSLLSNLREQIELQQRQYIARLSEKNKQEGSSFLNFNKQKDGVIVLPSGLQYTILKSGAGKSPTLFDAVKVHYTGTFIEGAVFDSSRERGEPIVFPVNRVIPGWSEILQIMKVGDHFKVFIPHYLAYGEHGFGRDIGPNTTLIFELEIL